MELIFGDFLNFTQGNLPEIDVDFIKIVLIRSGVCYCTGGSGEVCREGNTSATINSIIAEVGQKLFH